MEQSLITLDNCPSCGHTNFTNHVSAKDYTYSKLNFQLVKCSSCTLVFTNPLPSPDAIGKYYDNPEYVSHTDTKKGLLFTIYALVKTRALQQKRRLLEKQTTDRTVLDYGAGTGDFSTELAENGWSVTSYEPDANASAKILAKCDSISLINTIDVLEPQSISVVTLWHVLEHVHNLVDTLKNFNRLLTTQGTLIIAVPNYKSLDAKYYKQEWAAYDVPRHLYHFDFNSMKTLVENQGFILHEVKPMWFDSTYVSLLSEKNKNKSGILGWIRALVIGFLSNILALINTKKASSIIYIFKKAI